MKFASISLLLALSASAAVYAQTPETSAQAKKDVAAQKQDPLAIQTSAPQDWSQLKGHDQGYVTKNDALPNSWLAQNFVNCDKDQNGKVTEQEYKDCKKHKRE